MRLKWLAIVAILALAVFGFSRWWRYHQLTSDQRAFIEHLASDEYRKTLLNEAAGYAQSHGPHLTKGEVAGIVDNTLTEAQKEFWQRMRE